VSALVSLQSLSKRFGDVLAVDQLSLEVKAGEVVGLLGPNGAGKTTALRMLAGLITPTSGRAVVCGVDMKDRTTEARKSLGFLTASTGLYERLTGREVLTTFGQLYGLDAQGLSARVEALTRELDLKDFLDRRCSKLSSGQKQRVSIARSVVHDPAVYVLDEPTAALDPVASKAILDLVQRAAQRQKAVLFSTHRMEEAEFLCHRLVFMNHGRAVAEGSPEALRRSSGQSSLTGAFLHYAGALGASSQVAGA
jgi:sodium transport system ATP-binding protein